MQYSSAAELQIMFGGKDVTGVYLFIAHPDWNFTLLGLRDATAMSDIIYFILIQSNKGHYISPLSNLPIKCQMLSEVVSTYTYTKN